MHAGGSTSDLASLGRTLDKGLHKVIFDEQVASLALPFIGSGKASAVAVTAPFIVRQASTFLKTAHAPQSLKVVSKLDYAQDMKVKHPFRPHPIPRTPPHPTWCPFPIHLGYNCEHCLLFPVASSVTFVVCLHVICNAE